MSATDSVREIVKRLADREVPRSEATIQADVRQLLLTAPLALEDHQIDAPLEVPVGDGRRIDVEVGLTVIEVKRDLRQTGVRAAAIEQLAGYVQTRTKDLNQRYVGMLTDGAEWIAYHLVEDANLSEVARFELVRTAPNVDGLLIWLEGILATVQQIEPRSPTH